jgi:2-oxoglutarate ferredoxin oxidoreductase subunit delta
MKARESDPLEAKAVSPPKKSAQQTLTQNKARKKSRASKRKRSGKARQLYHQTIFRDWCKACGICSAFCPKKVIGRDNTGMPVIKRPDDCIGCRFCELHCPDFAITIQERDGERIREQ